MTTPSLPHDAAAGPSGLDHARSAATPSSPTYEPPWGSREVRRALSPHPAVRILEAFEVPFVALEADGEGGWASAPAGLLLSGEPGLWWHLVHWVSELSLAAATRAGLSCALPGYGSFGLTLRGIDTRTRVVPLVLIQPRGRSTRPVERPHAGLSPREFEIARLIASGEGGKQIARSLGISEHTTRHHTESIFRKLGVRSRAAVAAAVATWQAVGSDQGMGDSSHWPVCPTM